jgi:hypothetical protein
MNSLRFSWPTGLPRLLGSPKECPICTSIEFTQAESQPVSHLVLARITSDSLCKLLAKILRLLDDEQSQHMTPHIF